MLTAEEVIRRWDALDANLKAEFESQKKDIGKATDDIDGLRKYIKDVEQRMSRKGGQADDKPDTAGLSVINSDQFKSFKGRGKVAIEINQKSITSAVGSGGAFIPADHRPEPTLLARRRLTVRDLLQPGNTTSNAVEYPRQTTRTNNAAMVAEAASKPESDYAFELVTANVRTIAHWVTVSKQALEDSAILRGVIDGELRYGLALVEEFQFLDGDGTGQNLQGINTVADDFEWPYAVPTVPNEFDFLLAAIAKVEANLYQATGIVVNITKLRQLQSTKDNEARYIQSGGPFSGPIGTIWGVPVVGTPQLDAEEFLVGDFANQAQIFDRETAVVELSSEHSDYFTRNLLAVRAEERLAFSVKAPLAFVKGEFSYISG